MVIFLLKCLCSSANHQGWLVQPRPERHRHVGVPGAPLHRGGSGGGCTRKVEKFSLCHLEKWNQLGLCGVYIYIICMYIRIYIYIHKWRERERQRERQREREKERERERERERKKIK